MLTALAIDNAKPREKQYKLFDGNGLHLLARQAAVSAGAYTWLASYAN